MHLIVYFCGTGDTGYTFSRDHATYADELKDSNTYTLVVNGCHHPEVCNDGTMPDLEAFVFFYSINQRIRCCAQRYAWDTLIRYF